MFFQTLAKIEMMRNNNNRLFGHHFETVQHLNFFPEIWFFRVRTHMAQISLQNSGGKMVFLGGSMEPPMGTNGSKSTLVTLELKSNLVKRTLGQSIIDLGSQRSSKGQPDVNLFRNMQMSQLICNHAIIQQPKQICKSNLVKRTPFFIFSFFDNNVIYLWSQRSRTGQPEVNLFRNILWFTNVVRRTFDQSVIHSWGQRSSTGQSEITSSQL